VGEIVPLSLGLRSNAARNKQAGSAKFTNCFAEEQGEDGKSNWIIYGTEGLSEFAPTAAGGVREMLTVGDTLYVAVGPSVVGYDANAAQDYIGNIDAEGDVYMRSNRAVPPQIGLVVAGTVGTYYVIQSGSMSLISDTDLDPPLCLAWHDGYGILPVENGRYMITGLDNFSTIDALDEGVCESKPDELVRAEALGRQVVFFGTDSIEFHANTGDADFPYERQEAIGIGCLAAGSVCFVESPDLETLIWVAPDHTVRKLNGYSGGIISNPEISQAIHDLALADRASELRATSWAASGRFFYALSCDDWTKVYDGKTGFWHDRKSYGLNRWRVSQVTRFGNKLIAGDYDTGALYEMSERLYDEAGNYLVKEIITPTVHAFPHGVTFHALFLDIVLGVGLNSTNTHAAEPKILIDWSDDGGASWSVAREKSLGALGQRNIRVRINRLGTCGPKGRQFRFRISAPVETVMMSASVDMEILEPAHA
jgi:hypothetical protein